MRIVGGSFKGRKLHTPEGDAIRPTGDKARQAIFNMLETRMKLADVTALDAFCGTGALGLEALSRGAGFCVFMDKDKTALDLCSKNIKLMSLQERSKTFLKDAAKPGPKPAGIEPAGLVFLDPPYRQGLIAQALEGFKDWAAPDAVFVMEMAKDEIPVFPALRVLQDKHYGDTRVVIARRN